MDWLMGSAVCAPADTARNPTVSTRPICVFTHPPQFLKWGLAPYSVLRPGNCNGVRPHFRFCVPYTHERGSGTPPNPDVPFLPTHHLCLPHFKLSTRKSPTRSGRKLTGRGAAPTRFPPRNFCGPRDPHPPCRC